MIYLKLSAVAGCTQLVVACMEQTSTLEWRLLTLGPAYTNVLVNKKPHPPKENAAQVKQLTHRFNPGRSADAFFCNASVIIDFCYIAASKQ